MGTKLDEAKQKIIENLEQLPVEHLQLVLYILQNMDDLLPIVEKLHKGDEKYYDKLAYLVTMHRGGYEVDVVDGVQV